METHKVSDRLVDDKHGPRGVRSGMFTLQTSKHFPRRKLAMFHVAVWLWTGNLQSQNSYELEVQKVLDRLADERHIHQIDLWPCYMLTPSVLDSSM